MIIGICRQTHSQLDVDNTKKKKKSYSYKKKQTKNQGVLKAVWSFDLLCVAKGHIEKNANFCKESNIKPFAKF